jgi:hypothetical protein
VASNTLVDQNGANIFFEVFQIGRKGGEEQQGKHTTTPKGRCGSGGQVGKLYTKGDRNDRGFLCIATVAEETTAV